MESAAHELRTATSHPGASTPAGAAPISRSSTTAFAKRLLRKSVTFDDQVRAVELEVEESSVARARAIADHGGSGITHEDEPSSSSAATAAKVHSLLEHSRTEPTAAALAVEVESASQSQASDVASVALRGQPDDSPAPLLPSKQDGVIGSLLVAAMAASQPEISASLATKALASAACRESARRAEKAEEAFNLERAKRIALQTEAKALKSSCTEIMSEQEMFAGHMSNLHGVIAAVDEAVLRFHSGDGEAVPQPILEAVRKRCQAHSVSGPVTGEGSGPAASAPEPRFGTASLRPIPLPWQAARSAELREVIASEASEAVQWIVQHALKENHTSKTELEDTRLELAEAKRAVSGFAELKAALGESQAHLQAARDKAEQLRQLAASEAARRQASEAETADRMQQAEAQWESRHSALSLDAERAKAGAARACDAVKAAAAVLGSIESKAQLLALSMDGEPPDALAAIATEARAAKTVAMSALETARLARAAPQTPSSAVLPRM